jgi:hypothetical protein
MPLAQMNSFRASSMEYWRKTVGLVNLHFLAFSHLCNSKERNLGKVDQFSLWCRFERENTVFYNLSSPHFYVPMAMEGRGNGHMLHGNDLILHLHLFSP